MIYYYVSALGSFYILHVIMHSSWGCLSHCLTSEKSFSRATFGCVIILGIRDRMDLLWKVRFLSICISSTCRLTCCINYSYIPRVITEYFLAMQFMSCFDC